MDLDAFKVERAPNTLYYIPNFINDEEEDYLKTQIYNAPKPKWTQLSNRRLQNWGGIPSSKGMIVETIPDWLSKYCKKIASLRVFTEHEPNHILINEYLPNQGIMPHVDGPLYYPTVTTISLGSHTLLDFYRPLDSNELAAAAEDTNEESGSGSGAYEKRYLFSVLVEPKSLLVLQDDMYKTYLHGIRELSEDVISKSKIINYEHLGTVLTSDNESAAAAAEAVVNLKRQTRVSLTIRYVPKILKLNVNSLLSKKK